MKYLQVIFLLGCIFFVSCGLNEREKVLKGKETQLNAKQQELLLWEQQLTQKETELNEREHKLDSTRNEIDSVAIHGPSLSGIWQIKMQCVETSCDGSAIGDVKTERWEFSEENNSIIVKAFAGKTMVRIYNGSYTQTGIKLVENNSQPQSNMEVNLRILKEGKMEGTRDITLPNCKTSYSISANR